MLDLFTYFVYILLLFTVVFLLNISSKYSKTYKENQPLLILERYRLNGIHIITLLIISFIVGVRYDVGHDWGTYARWYQYYQSNPYITFDSQPLEFGYYLVNKLSIMLGGEYPLMFALIAFISWCFIFKSISYKLLPLLMFFLFVDEYFFISMNLVRQFVALSIFLFSIKFIAERKIAAYFITIVVATLFHSSAIILLPLYFLPYDKLYNHKLWILIFFISIFFANTPGLINLFLQIFAKLTEVVPYLNVYTRYILNDRFTDFRLEVGLGYVFRLFVSFFLLYFSKDVIKAEPRTKIYYTLYFFSIIIYNLFYMIPLITRFNHYFLITRSVVLAFSAWFLWKKRKFRVFIVLLMVMYFILYMASIYNASHKTGPYRTIYNKEMI